MIDYSNQVPQIILCKDDDYKTQKQQRKHTTANMLPRFS